MNASSEAKSAPGLSGHGYPRTLQQDPVDLAEKAVVLRAAREDALHAIDKEHMTYRTEPHPVRTAERQHILPGRDRADLHGADHAGE